MTVVNMTSEIGGKIHFSCWEIDTKKVKTLGAIFHWSHPCAPPTHRSALATSPVCLSVVVVCRFLLL